MFRYYSTQRPIELGSFPKPKGNKVIEIYNYDGQQYIPEINAEAWGFVEYKGPLTEQEAADYELLGESK